MPNQGAIQALHIRIVWENHSIDLVSSSYHFPRIT